MQEKPLAGYRILDMTEVWAGPMSATYMAEMGAEVIRVESYPRAAQNRPLVPPLPGAQQSAAPPHDDPRVWERATSYHLANHSKQAIALDAAKPEGYEVLMRLIDWCDIFMIGYSAGTAARLRVDYETLRLRKPNLLMVSMPGWGERGVYQGFATIGSGLDAFSGHHYLRSYPGMDPSSNTASVVHSDAVGAVVVTFGLLTALHYRERTGTGQYLDMSQAESLITQIPRPIFEWTMNQRVLEPIGNTDPAAVPHNTYRCAGEDNWAVIAVRTDEQWRALASALGNPDWAADPELASLLGRLRHRDAIDAHLTEWTKQRTNVEVFERLQDFGVPSAPVYRTTEVLEDPHLAARGFFRMVQHPIVADYKRPRAPWTMSKTTVDEGRSTNLVGEHNREVLRDILGYSDAEVDALEAADVIGDTYRKGADLG